MSVDAFARHRSLLFTVAYEMLGSAADAEDVVQETWLRWADVDHTVVLDPRAYLVRIVTRQSLNRLRSVARRREDYVGEWLPEPLLTSPEVASDVELAESVSIAMLTVLETLGPAERAVFVLREVFDIPYEEIADAVGKSPAAVRQIAHRARDHVAARRPRVPVSTTEQQEAVDRFIAAVRHGDLQASTPNSSPRRRFAEREWRCSVAPIAVGRSRSGCMGGTRGRANCSLTCGASPGTAGAAVAPDSAAASTSSTRVS